MSYKRSVFISMYVKHKRTLQWICCDVLPVTAAVALFCAGCLAVMFTIGEMQPPGPGAFLSSLHSSSNTISFTDRYDDPAPGTTYATRTGQDLAVVR